MIKMPKLYVFANLKVLLFRLFYTSKYLNSFKKLDS